MIHSRQDYSYVHHRHSFLSEETKRKEVVPQVFDDDFDVVEDAVFDVVVGRGNRGYSSFFDWMMTMTTTMMRMSFGTYWVW